MKAAISKWVKDLVKDPDKGLELLEEISRTQKNPHQAGEIVVDGKRYKVRLAGTASVPVPEK